MCSYGGAWLRKTSQHAKQLHTRAKSFEFCILPRLISASFPREVPVFCWVFFSSFLHSPLPSCYVFDPFIYRGQESFMGSWIPSAILWWISIRRINSVFCLWNQSRLHTNTQTSTGAIYHPRKFHHVVCLPCKEKGKEWKPEMRPIFHEELLHRCSVVFFSNREHQFYFCFFHEKNVASRKRD